MNRRLDPAAGAAGGRLMSRVFLSPPPVSKINHAKGWHVKAGVDRARYFEAMVDRGGMPGGVAGGWADPCGPSPNPAVQPGSRRVRPRLPQEWWGQTHQLGSR